MALMLNWIRKACTSSTRHMDVKGALKVYRNFKVLRAAPTWGDYPVSCSCKTNFGHCVCGDTLLFVSLFDPKVQVPKGYVGATVSERKQ